MCAYVHARRLRSGEYGYAHGAARHGNGCSSLSREHGDAVGRTGENRWPTLAHNSTSQFDETSNRCLRRAVPSEQRILIRTFDGLEAKIDVQVRPVEVVWRWLFDVEDLGDGGVFEPRKVIEGQEQLPIPAEDPDAMLRDVGDFNV